jgi:ABC-2 type transport system ATP-binding protein/lipopolysaccharide transport system ATP-binding protein
MAYINLKNVFIDFPVFNAGKRPTNLNLFQKVIGGKLSKTSGTTSIRALEDINLNFSEGDRVGLVGHNGAGKTTLLRVLAGVYPPTTGTVTFSGRIVPLFDISLGFDFELTGYDNILLRGLFLGLSKSELSICKTKIATFTGLGDYLEMPLRTYSSGMLMRLAFAIATAVQPDIILMDEWIGVGDTEFLDQAKTRLESFIDNSNITVLASHSETLIRSICNKAVLLGQGQVLAQGSVDEVFNYYNFFGSSSFFDIEEYVELHPDLKDAMTIPGMAPWMHFIKYGIFEGRSPRPDIPLEAFSKDPAFNQAIALKDGLAAADRIERVAPFLKTFHSNNNHIKSNSLPYPEDFISQEDYPLISREEADK